MLAPSWHPLSWIDAYLLTRGWTNDARGWLPPAHWRAAMGTRYGHYRREQAIAIQVRFDERTLPQKGGDEEC